ncbi:MAG: DUF6165 family protein [Bacteroidales bacterium]|jgi:K+-sensing histidine kinase KdpD
MKIELSNGELLDRLTILEIKLDKIQDAAKLVNIREELSQLKPLVENMILSVSGQYKRLTDINRQLWEIEDIIRELENKKQFDDVFIQTARQVYLMNDERAAVKKEINLLTNSGLIEEKSYAGY